MQSLGVSMGTLFLHKTQIKGKVLVFVLQEVYTGKPLLLLYTSTLKTRSLRNFN
jgi:hypothetical protein